MDTKELIEKYQIRANKNFGQNFLHRADIIDLIATAAKGTACAVEIGAGLGVLSARLCKEFERVVTVEIDKSLEKVTAETVGAISNHTLIYQNFLKTDLSSFYDEFGGEFTIVGNLPYNITGDIITKLIKNNAYLTRAVVMVQKEAAEKFIAQPTDPQYRAISVLAGVFCEIETVCEVSPDCFIPAPHVQSRVITLRFKKDLSIPENKQKDFFAFVHNIFSKRRKKLVSIFQNSEQKEKATEILESFGFSDSVRGEALTPEQFARLYCLMFCE